MHAARTISAILSGSWLILPTYVQNNLPLISSILDGTFQGFHDDADDDEKQASQPQTIIVGANAVVPVYYGYYSDKRIQEAPDGSIAKIAIEHPITRHNNCGDMGSLTLAEQIRKINASQNFTGIILEFNSPGGMVSGTQIAAEAIANSVKPIVSFVNDGIAASAAYWLASQTDAIYVSNQTSMVGSIGVYVTFADFKEYYESKGIKIHEVYSRLSSEKNQSFKEALEGNYDLIQNDLDTIANLFIDTVKSKRNINPNAADPFKGKMFYADEAQEIGLIDGTLNLEGVVAKVTQLAKTKGKIKFYV